MVTAGMDARVKVWDIRKFGDDPVANYFVPTPARTVDVSQRGLVAVGFGSHVQVRKRCDAAAWRLACLLVATF